MISESQSHLLSSFALNVQHHPQRFSGLVWPELVDQVVHVNKEQVEVFDLLIPLGRIGCFDEEVKEVEEVDQNRLVEFRLASFQFKFVCYVLYFTTEPGFRTLVLLTAECNNRPDRTKRVYTWLKFQGFYFLLKIIHCAE